MKRKYYVSLVANEISQVPYENNTHFVIEASEGEVEQLRKIFEEINNADRSGYWRAHVPFRPYHQDESNDQYDNQLTAAHHLLYRLGDETTKAGFEEMVASSDQSL